MGVRMKHAIPQDLKQISLINIYILRYNFQSLGFMNKISSVGNIRLFYFVDDGKLELFPIEIYIFPEFFFCSFNRMQWNNTEQKSENILCVSIIFKYTVCYLIVIGNIQNDECLIYIFKGGVLNGTTNIFNSS